MSPPIRILGLIAGSRSLPIILARQARAAGVERIIAVGFIHETDPKLGDEVDHLAWVRVGQLSRLIHCFQEHQVHHCVMAGQIAPRNLFELRPDLRTLKVLLSLPEKNAHTLFAAVARELNKEGIELVEATPWLKPCMPGPGFALGPSPAPRQLQDAQLGFRTAKEIARLDIGQTVVVKNGTVLAVEGFEGTDACLLRGGQLAGPAGEAVAVKVAKPNHDMRFDLPCVGPQTLETCQTAGIRLLGVEADKTLLLEQETLEELTHKHRIGLVTLA